ncbi:fibronectin type III domain-containing protein [Chryseobacterium sp. 3008163]|uniref:Ig-like domain-containing protein n=1 Tax=Chryseobacterium sp. 3008163 TaxID=2478663 RepID=UPI000F0C4B20|nr:fibronectin type III domain-containing protein [Chryseobacterium sp. 3008163]AYM99523.1 T9SS C-terminal target domain-containing protein [Chryseobacterium sp. 3008163]
MKKLLLTCMLALSYGVFAQVGPPQSTNPNTNNGYGFAQSSGAYVPLTAGKTVWQSGATLATNGVSGPINLPSPFKFNGKSYSIIYISNNGFITFGSAPVATAYTGLSTNSAVPNLAEGAVAGFANNLINANTTTSEIAYEAISGKFIVQFTDLKNTSGSATQLLNFQIQLDITNNSVQIVYGNCVSGTATTTGEVGLRGADGRGDVNNRLGTDWTATTSGTANSSSCTLGITNGTTVPANGLTFTYTPGTWIAAPTTYATLPFTENFSSWANGNSTGDLPNITYWRTWPSRGNGSWRQNDLATANLGYTGTSGWYENTEGTTTTIAAPAVAPTARFHSYYATAGQVGNMDLYVDLSSGGSGVRVLSFDYRNVSGTDKLEVLYSTDGGVTFTSVGSLTTNSAWTKPSYVINSTAANAILRLSATADYGSDDIFVDNLNIIVTTTPPACTTTTAPLNNATGVSITPTVTWAASVGASSYKINLGTVPGGTDVLNSFDVGNVLTYVIPTATPLMYGKLYYVTVLPTNANGTASGCTEFSFTTKNLNCPSVTAPSSAATGVSTTPAFTWGAVTDATGYKLTIGTTAGGNNILNAFDLGNVTTYTLPTPLMIGTKYFYTINAYNSYNSSLSCTERNFTTAGCATVSAPTAAATGVSLTPTFTWAAVTGVTGYKLTIGTTTGGNNILNAYDVGNVTTHTLSSPLALGTKYFYTVNSYDATTTTASCTERNFTTITACPTVSAPASAATGVSVTPTFTWAANANATGYKLTIGTTTGGSDVLNAFDVGNVTTYTLPNPLNNGIKYFYTISGYNATSTSLGCTERNFTTVVTCFVPTVPAITASSVTSSGATATWTAPTSAPSNGYEVYYSTSNTVPTFSTPLNATNSVVSSTTTASIGGLIPSTLYYVWVRSVCSGPDRSAWTSVVSFVTLCQPPAMISTTGATVCPNTAATLSASADAGATINWYNATSGGTSLGTGANFTTPAIATTTSYYADASYINNLTGQARVTYATVSATDPIDYGLVFDAAKSFKLNSVKIFLERNATTNLVVNLTNSAGTILQTITIPSANLPTGGTTTTPVSYTIALGWDINAGAGYRLMANSGPYMIRESSLGGFPYSLGDAGNITSGYISSASPSYYYFYSWDVTTVCASSPRQQVVATVDSTGCPGLATSEVDLNKNEIKAYPNPFADVLNVSDVKNVKSISIVDIAGRVVKTIEKPSSSLQLRELNSGMYMVILYMNDGSRQTIKAIKK